MPLTAQEIAAIRERAERATPNEDYTQRVQWAFADRLSLLSHISALTAQLGAAREALQALADAADQVGVRFFDTDTMEPEVEAMQTATLQARAVAAKMPAKREG